MRGVYEVSVLFWQIVLRSSPAFHPSFSSPVPSKRQQVSTRVAFAEYHVVYTNSKHSDQQLDHETLSFENNFIMSYWEWLVCKIGSLSYCSLLCWPDQPSSCRLNRFIFSENGPSFDIYATIWDPLVIHLFINLLIGSLMNTNATVTCFT